MRIRAVTASVVGEPSSGVWAQVVITPKAYAVIEVVRETQEEATSVGNHIAAQLVDALSDPPISLDSVELLAKDNVRQGVSSLLLLVPVGNVIYLTNVGGGVAYLKRGGLFARLLNAEGSVSGEVSVGDAVILLGDSMQNNLDEAQISSSFDHLHPEELAEKLTLLLHQKSPSVKGAALIFEVAGYKEEELPPAVDDEEPAIERISPWQTVFSRQRMQRIYRRLRTGQLPTGDEMRGRLSGLDKDSKNVLLGVAVVAGLLFLFCVFLGIRKVAGFGLSAKAKETVIVAQRSYDEGLALRDLNPIESRKKIKEAKTTLDQIMKNVNTSSADGRKVAALYAQISENLTLSLRVYQVKPEAFFDVSLLKKSAKADALSITGDTLVLLDKTNITAYAVNVATKNGQAIAGADTIAGLVMADAGADVVYVLTSAGVMKIPLGSKPAKEPVIKKDDMWGTITRIVAFGGNIYLLDTSKSRIWKYIATETGFTDRREYLNPDTLPDLTKATGLSIDGSVWVSALDGKILKFIQGKEQTFLPAGVDPPLGSPLFVYTDDDSTNLYVLDPANNRVVALDKDGVYISQYVWEGALKPVDLAVSEKQKKILLLADGIVYAVDLK